MLLLLLIATFGGGARYPFNDVTLSTDARVGDLLGRMSLKDKVGQLFMNAKMAWGNDVLPAGGDLASTSIPRLGVPAFNWMSQGNVYRGVANGCDIGCCSCYDGHNMSHCCTDGYGTQLPQGTGVAATFNVELVFDAGVVASTESRAMQNHFPNRKVADYRTGASSVINILRDGRWGRAPETYGECPRLTGDIAVAFNKGIAGFKSLNASARQFNGTWKVLGTVRHFVAYAGPDSQRFNFDAKVSDDDLRLTYLPAWAALVKSGALGGVMSAISAMNGVPSAASKTMLTDVLRGEWGFDGFVTSDCDTISAISQSFHFTATVVQATAAALKAGGDINCGPEYALLLNATADGFVTEDEIDVSVRRALRRRVQVGDLDPPDHAGPYDSIPLSVVDSAPHKKVAHDVALESVVLLRNPDDVLPLDRSKLSTVLVVGPSADDIAIQAHTYHGNPSKWITVYDAVVTSAGASVEVTLLPGCSRTSSDRSGFAAVLAAAALADAVIYVGGLEASMEEEGTDRIGSIGLPGVQLDLIQALEGATRARSTPLVAVIVSGGPVVDPWMATSKAGWLWLSYFGQDGSGVGEIIFGDASPSGRLPFTMPADAASFGDITDYSMTSGPHGRTYRYWRYDSPGSWPVFPFAYGLSYAKLSLGKLGLSVSAASIGAQVQATVAVTNHGARSSLTAVVLFCQFLDPAGRPSAVTALPLRQMVGSMKSNVAAGATVDVVIPFSVGDIPGAARQPFPGSLRLWVGDATPPELASAAPAGRYSLPSASAMLNLVLK